MVLHMVRTVIALPGRGIPALDADAGRQRSAHGARKEGQLVARQELDRMCGERLAFPHPLTSHHRLIGAIVVGMTEFHGALLEDGFHLRIPHAHARTAGRIDFGKDTEMAATTIQPNGSEVVIEILQGSLAAHLDFEPQIGLANGLDAEMQEAFGGRRVGFGIGGENSSRNRQRNLVSLERLSSLYWKSEDFDSKT
jgi:hypothetical protein